MQTNSYLQMKNYFHFLVEKSNFLNDYVGFFSREYAEKEASHKGLNDPLLALFRYELGFDSPGENALAVRKIGFSIQYNDVPKDDLELQYIAINNAEDLALKVLARIRLDNYNRDHFLYNAFIQDSVQILPLELSLNNFGVDVFFNLKNKQSMKVDVNDWKDLEKVC